MNARPLKFNLRSGDLLYYLHIRKTAGTSFYALLESQFKPSQTCSLHWSSLDKGYLDPAEIEHCRLVRGHFDYTFYRYVTRPPVYVTMLRDPVERVLSLYDHITRVDNHPQYEAVKAGEVSLHDFVTGDEFYFDVVNTQTRLIAASRTTTADEISDSALLEMAKVHLDEFAFFGLAERFAESVYLLSYTFGWPPFPQTQRLNESPGRPRRESIDPQTIAAIEERTQLDADLYRFAERLLDQRLAQMGDELLRRRRA